MINIEIIIISLIMGIFSLTFAHVYYNLIEGLTNDVYIKRLIRASIKLDRYAFLDLSLAYFIGFLLYLILLINLGIVSYSNDSSDSKSIIPIIFAVLTILYLGRIISNRKGAFFGKVHYTALLVSSSFLMMSKLASEILLPILAGKLTFSGVYLLTVEWTEELISFLWDTNCIIMASIGVFLLSTIGELVLSKMPHNPKSLLGISEHIPNFFIVVGQETFLSTYNSMIRDEKLIAIKSTTTSLWAIENLDHEIFHNIRNVDYRFLMTSKEETMERIKKEIWESNSIRIDYLTSKNRKSGLFFDFIKEYEMRHHLLVSLLNRNLINARRYNFGTSIYIITKYSDKHSKLLIFLSDLDLRKRRIGLLTEEPFIIDVFENAFDLSWDKGERII